MCQGDVPVAQILPHHVDSKFKPLSDGTSEQITVESGRTELEILM